MIAWLLRQVGLDRRDEPARTRDTERFRSELQQHRIAATRETTRLRQEPMPATVDEDLRRLNRTGNLPEGWLTPERRVAND